MSAQTSLSIKPGAIKAGAAVRIIPAGSFCAYDGRPGSTHGQKFTAWSINAAIAAALVNAKPKGADAYLIDYEHQSLRASGNGQPVPAAGWFKRLEWREGEGLFMADIEWSERAKSMIANGEYRHVSPVFSFDLNTGAVTVIHSVGLTNNPAIEGLANLAAATAQSGNGDAGNASGASNGTNAEDAAKLKHAFGDIPGLNIDAVISTANVAHAAATAHQAPGLVRVEMNEQQRSYFCAVFGKDALNGL